MPNWAEGTFKIRGTKESVTEFLNKGFEAIDSRAMIAQVISQARGEEVERTPNEITIDVDDWKMSISSPEGLYIKGTRRAFIEGVITFYHSEFEDYDVVTLAIDNFKQAWGVESEPFAEISKAYNVDIRIHVFECGMEFNQIVEIEKGKIIRNDEIKYGDYVWECPFPNMGG